MTARYSVLAVVAVFTLTACEWFDDLVRQQPDSDDEGDGVGVHGGSDGGELTGGTGGMSGASGMDGGDAEVDGPPDSGPDAPELDGGLAAELTWQPEPRRFAVVDDPALLYEQPRLWLLVHGGEDRHRLVSFRSDVPGNPWLDTEITGVTSNPEALVSYQLGTSFERVFFTRDGELHMYRYDSGAVVDQDDDAGTDDRLDEFQPRSGHTLPGGDLAAIPVNVGGTENLMFVLAPAEKGGEPGHYCMFELNLRTQAHEFRCSEAPQLSEDTEIVAALGPRYIYFLARSKDHGLIAIAYDFGDGSIEHVSFDTPMNQPIGASLAVYEGDEDVGFYNLHVMVVGEDGRAYQGTIQKDLADMTPLWAALPDLPSNGELRRTGAALSAIDDLREVGGGQHRSTTVFGLGEDGIVYRTETEDGAQRDQWTMPWVAVPPLDGDQEVLALGAISRVTQDPDGLLHTLAQSWNIVGGERGRVLQEARETASSVVCEDHMRPEAPTPIAVHISAGAEISVASGADLGIAAAARRSSEAPQIVLSGSIDNASRWHSVPLMALPVEGERSVATLDPAVGYGGGRIHLLDREVPDLGECSSLEEASPQRIVYRRGDDVRAIAALGAEDENVKIVASGGRYGAPSMVVTGSEGGTVVHALFNDLGASNAQYWRLRPGSRGTIERALGPELPMSALQLASGVDSSVYAAGLRDQALQVCDMSDDELPTTLFCTEAVLDAQVLQRSIPFGSAETQQQGECPMVDGQHYKCFEDGKPYSLAVSLREPNKLYVAYAGDDQGMSSIYLSSSSGGADYGEWTTTRVNLRPGSDKKEYFDAELTVDAQGAITVTYSALAPNSAIAQAFSAHRTGDTGAFYIAPLGAWNAAELPFDCVTQRWALGDYRDPDTLGGRSLHVLRSDDAAESSHVTRWLNDNVLP